jgi:phosphoribosylamine--glycine ligase
MKILVIGQGGREHAIAWKLAKSKRAEAIFVAPGNGGTRHEEKCVNIDIDVLDFEAIKQFILDHSVSLVVVGPEDPLVQGIKDYLVGCDVMVFGPDSVGAQLEGSKIYSKEFMFENNIPTGVAKFFSEASIAKEYLDKINFPIVLKADGLAAGKGVLVTENRQEALDWIDDVMENSKFGDAGQKILIEECLYGTELSFMGIMTPDCFIPFETSIDYKPLFDGNKGPNTGGMGCMSPSPFMNDELKSYIFKEVVSPTIDGLRKRGINYYGFMYFGLMVKDNKPKVLEYNCRLGDPETQCLMMQMESDFLEILLSCLEDKEPNIEWNTGASMGVVIASGGYPNAYQKGEKITLGDVGDCKLFHAGTKSLYNELVTSGGRVFSLNYQSKTIDDCKKYIYEKISSVDFSNCTHRTDIGDIYES